MSDQLRLDGRLDGGASLSPDGTYRYTLWRAWHDGVVLGHVCWIGLNPSTADARVDDPTVRRIRGFTRRWGFSGFTLVNLYALRATDPRELAGHPDPIGPDNDQAILHAVTSAPFLVAAWGAHPMAKARADWLRGAIGQRTLHCLGRGGNGYPVHPLYQSGNLPPMEWS